MSDKITNKKILVLRNFTVEPLLNELEDKFLNRDIKCKFDISTYNSAITDVLKIKKTKIDQYECVIIFLSFEVYQQQSKKIEKILRSFKKQITDLIHILSQKKFKNINLFYFFSNELIKQSVKKIILSVNISKKLVKLKFQM